MPQSFVSLHCHVVFAARKRQALITSDLQYRLYDFIGEILEKRECKLVAAGGMTNHVHLLISLSKVVAVSDLLRDVKAISSGWVHKTFPGRRDFEWQTGYGAFAVSYSGIEVVKKYIANQEDHHRTMTFKEEFVGLLKKHEIPYDERYLWAEE